MSDKLANFLRRVPTANWRIPPPIWNEELREALNEGFVTFGFGGVLKLTEAGRQRGDKQ